MKRVTLVTMMLAVSLILAWPQVLAQEPARQPVEQVDDLTPSRPHPAGKVDDSDKRRVPPSYWTASGGPDRFGYTYTDSPEPACAYAWVELDQAARELEFLHADDGTGAIPIGFVFPFYGQEYTHLTVDSNGVLLLGAGASDWINRPLGSDGPSPRLAPFWDDLVVDSVRYQVLGAAPGRTLVVTFQAQRQPAGELRFQVLLNEDGRIVFQYDALSGPAGDGTSATVGIQGAATGLGYLFNGYPEENRLREKLSVCFQPPDGIYLSPGIQHGYGAGGQDVVYTVSAINQTGADGAFDLSVESPWPVAVMPQQVTIGDGAVLDLAVTVRVPGGVAGERVETVIRMTGGAAGRPVEQTVARLETVRAAGDYGYTGASTTDEVAIFDLETWTLLDTLSLLPEGDYPYDATMSPDGDEVWIPGASGDGVVVVDTGTNQISQRIAVGEYSISAAFRQDSAYVFVSNRDTEDVTVVDANTYTVVDSIPIPTHYLGAGNLALNPVSGEIYVVDWYDEHFLVLDTEAFTVTQEIPLGDSLWQLVVHPMGGYLYITDRGLDVVHVLDTETLTETDTIPVGDDPWGIDITPDGALIYVTNEDSHDVTAIDASDNSVITTISLPHGTDSDPRDVDFSMDGAYAYVPSGSVTGDDVVYVIDTTTHAVVGQVNVAPASNPNVVAVAPQMVVDLGLAADKWAAPEPVVLGDALTYTIAFSYTGLVSATNVMVTDTLPGGVAYLTSTGGLSSTYDATEHHIVWDLGEVSASAAGQLAAVVLPEDEALMGQVITNEAYLDFTSFSNFSATVWATSTVLSPELAIRFPDGSEPPAPLLLCAGDVVTLTAVTNRPGPLEYVWNLGDGTVVDTPVVTHGWTYGDYTVWLTTTNAYGWVETDTLDVEVGHMPVAGFLSNSPVMLGQNAVFTDQTAYEPAEWSWNFGDGVGVSDESNPIYSYSNPGPYTVTLTTTNRCGIDVHTDLFEVLEPILFHYVYLPLVIKDQP